MSQKNKNAPGDGASSDNGNGSNYCQSHSSIFLSELQQQAADKMASDPANFGKHSAIFLSVTYLKNGWPWPPKGWPG